MGAPGPGPNSAPAEPALASRSARSLPRKPAWPGIHLSSTWLPSASPLSWVLQSRTDLELAVLRQRARRAAWLSDVTVDFRVAPAVTRLVSRLNGDLIPLAQEKGGWDRVREDVEPATLLESLEAEVRVRDKRPLLKGPHFLEGHPSIQKTPGALRRLSFDINIQRRGTEEGIHAFKRSRGWSAHSHAAGSALDFVESVEVALDAQAASPHEAGVTDRGADDGSVNPPQLPGKALQKVSDGINRGARAYRGHIIGIAHLENGVVEITAKQLIHDHVPENGGENAALGAPFQDRHRKRAAAQGQAASKAVVIAPPREEARSSTTWQSERSLGGVKIPKAAAQLRAKGGPIGSISTAVAAAPAAVSPQPVSNLAALSQVHLQQQQQQQQTTTTTQVQQQIVEQPGANYRNPELPDLIEYLRTGSETTKCHAAAYLQHLTFCEEAIKSQVRAAGGIPLLVRLLSTGESGSTELQRNVLGALRNLSYGQRQEENKREMCKAGGLQEARRLLETSPDQDVKELATAVMWNISVSPTLKKDVLDTCLDTLVQRVLLPHAGLERRGEVYTNVQREIYWTVLFRNATGVIRSVSSCGDYARRRLRSADGLVESLRQIIQCAVDNSDLDGKAVENCVCTLRNLVYACQEVEDPAYLRRHAARATGGSGRGGTGAGCFGRRSSRGASSGSGASGKPGATSGAPTIIQRRLNDIVPLLLPIVADCTNPETLEAAAGALQNLAACDWQPSVDIRAHVRKERGLPLLVELLGLDADKVVQTAATALRNLAQDERNKDLIGKYALEALTGRLPGAPTPQGAPAPFNSSTSSETYAAVIATLYTVLKDNFEFSRHFLELGGVRLLMNSARDPAGRYGQKVSDFSWTLLVALWRIRELQPLLRQAGWTEAQFTPPKRSGSGVGGSGGKATPMGGPGMSQSGPGARQDSMPKSRLVARQAQPQQQGFENSAFSGDQQQQQLPMASRELTYAQVDKDRSVQQLHQQDAPAVDSWRAGCPPCVSSRFNTLRLTIMRGVFGSIRPALARAGEFEFSIRAMLLGPDYSSLILQYVAAEAGGDAWGVGGPSIKCEAERREKRDWNGSGEAGDDAQNSRSPLDCPSVIIGGAWRELFKRRGVGGGSLLKRCSGGSRGCRVAAGGLRHLADCLGQNPHHSAGSCADEATVGRISHCRVAGHVWRHPAELGRHVVVRLLHLGGHVAARLRPARVAAGPPLPPPGPPAPPLPPPPTPPPPPIGVRLVGQPIGPAAYMPRIMEPQGAMTGDSCLASCFSCLRYFARLFWNHTCGWERLADSSSVSCSWVNVVLCRRRAGVGHEVAVGLCPPPEGPLMLAPPVPLTLTPLTAPPPPPPPAPHSDLIFFSIKSDFPLALLNKERAKAKSDNNNYIVIEFVAAAPSSMDTLGSDAISSWSPGLWADLAGSENTRHWAARAAPPRAVVRFAASTPSVSAATPALGEGRVGWAAPSPRPGFAGFARGQPERPGAAPPLPQWGSLPHPISLTGNDECELPRLLLSAHSDSNTLHRDAKAPLSKELELTQREGCVSKWAGAVGRPGRNARKCNCLSLPDTITGALSGLAPATLTGQDAETAGAELPCGYQTLNSRRPGEPRRRPPGLAESKEQRVGEIETESEIGDCRWTALARAERMFLWSNNLDFFFASTRRRGGWGGGGCGADEDDGSSAQGNRVRFRANHSNHRIAGDGAELQAQQQPPSQPPAPHQAETPKLPPGFEIGRRDFPQLFESHLAVGLDLLPKSAHGPGLSLQLVAESGPPPAQPAPQSGGPSDWPDRRQRQQRPARPAGRHGSAAADAGAGSRPGWGTGPDGAAPAKRRPRPDRPPGQPAVEDKLDWCFGFFFFVRLFLLVFSVAALAARAAAASSIAWRSSESKRAAAAVAVAASLRRRQSSMKTSGGEAAGELSRLADSRRRLRRRCSPRPTQRRAVAPALKHGGQLAAAQADVRDRLCRFDFVVAAAVPNAVATRLLLAVIVAAIPSRRHIRLDDGLLGDGPAAALLQEFFQFGRVHLAGVTGAAPTRGGRRRRRMTAALLLPGGRRGRRRRGGAAAAPTISPVDDDSTGS
uniref:Armadillo repeat-containing protein 4 n=1 Tax=Macrostomum lignano TaxID=282301 RepID=A0A1I8IDZ9_9PLAT